jgi:hypothetical protein
MVFFLRMSARRGTWRRSVTLQMDGIAVSQYGETSLEVGEVV